MIHYQLHCACGHGFDGWFASSAAFDQQRERKLVSCPACQGSDVDRALMAPAVGLAAKKRAAANPAKQPAFAADPHAETLKQALQELRSKVEQNADYVGDRFAEEARKIHYEESPPRGIYGEATGEEVKSLREEGIEAYPLPVLPDDMN